MVMLPFSFWALLLLQSSCAQAFAGGSGRRRSSFQIVRKKAPSSSMLSVQMVNNGYLDSMDPNRPWSSNNQASSSSSRQFSSNPMNAPVSVASPIGSASDPNLVSMQQPNQQYNGPPSPSQMPSPSQSSFRPVSAASPIGAASDPNLVGMSNQYGPPPPQQQFPNGQQQPQQQQPRGGQQQQYYNNDWGNNNANQQQQYPPNSNQQQQQQRYPPSHQQNQQNQQRYPPNSNQQQQRYPSMNSNQHQQQQYPPNFNQQQQYPPNSNQQQQQRYPPNSNQQQQQYSPNLNQQQQQQYPPNMNQHSQTPWVPDASNNQKSSKPLTSASSIPWTPGTSGHPRNVEPEFSASSSPPSYNRNRSDPRGAYGAPPQQATDSVNNDPRYGPPPQANAQQRQDPRYGPPQQNAGYQNNNPRYGPPPQTAGGGASNNASRQQDPRYGPPPMGSQQQNNNARQQDPRQSMGAQLQNNNARQFVSPAAKQSVVQNTRGIEQFIHHGYKCDQCLTGPIIGKRFRATSVPGYDLCEACHSNYQGTPGIIFEQAGHEPAPPVGGVATTKEPTNRNNVPPLLMAPSGKAAPLVAQESEGEDSLPLEFHVREKWPYLDELQAPVLKSTGGKQERFDPYMVKKTIAYRCINYRGWIAHGKVGLGYGFEQARDDPSSSIKEVFDANGGTNVLAVGGLKPLRDITSVKEEIWKRGPVTVTFEFTDHFMSDNAFYVDSLETSRIDLSHPKLNDGFKRSCFGALIIVGWTWSEEFGELWLVRSVRGDVDVPIATGFATNGEILAPLSNFTQQYWQDPSIAVDIKGMSDCEDWYSWPAMTTRIDDAETKALSKVLGCGFVEAAAAEQPIVIRDSEMIAHSRLAYVNDIQWQESMKEWLLSVTFCDE